MEDLHHEKRRIGEDSTKLCGFVKSSQNKTKQNKTNQKRPYLLGDCD